MALTDSIEPGLLQGARRVVETLTRAGHEAFFAGGAVRDLLLGRGISDIDIATSAPPEVVECFFERTLPVGRQFGVIVVLLEDREYEVATFRVESDYRNGRHPTRVAFAEAREDARRRDFTVNALFYDPQKEEVLDFVDGRKDLERRLIRTVGDPKQRFEEDKLRLMRAVRFACDLGFEIDSSTYEQLAAQADSIGRVSSERIRDELLKILCRGAASRGLRIMLDTGLLEAVLPEVVRMVGVEQPPQFHPEGDVFTHTCLMFELAGELTPTLALGVLLHDVGKPPTFRVAERIRFDGHADAGAEMAGSICRRLRLPNETVRIVTRLVKDHLKFMHVREMRESTLKRFMRQEKFDEHLELHRLDCLASHGDLTNYEYCVRKLEEFAEESIRPEPILRGEDLIEIGFKPGPIFSEILGRLEDLQLEGEIETREEAFEYVRRNWGWGTGD